MIDFDQPFVDGLQMLVQNGVVINLYSAAPANEMQYHIPTITTHILEITLHTDEVVTLFDDWMKKERFRFNLKGLVFLQLVSEDQYIGSP